MLKMHARHLEEMQEMQLFTRSLTENMERATYLYNANQELLNEMCNHPFQTFFNNLKKTLLEKLDELETRVGSLYK